MGGKREEVGAVMKIGYRVAIVRYYFPFFAVDYAIDNNEINTLCNCLGNNHTMQLCV